LDLELSDRVVSGKKSADPARDHRCRGRREPFPIRRRAISCVSTMDHSWGPRPEVSNMSWFHAHFGENLALHCIFPCVPSEFASYGPLAHGYVLENGKMYRLATGRGTARRESGQQMTMTIEVTDVRGRTFELNGHAIATYPWIPWPAVVAFHSLNEWSLGGRRGYGECMDKSSTQPGS
jgi:hypothetical protein